MRASCGKTSFSALQKCCYSAQTGSRAVEKVRVLKEEGKVTRLPNGVNIATVENLSPVVRLAYVVNAGSRFESADNLGVTHVIRRATILANKKYSNFGLVRNLQQIGASLTCSTTREQVIYAVECLRSQVPLALDILSNAALSGEFKPWEVSDNTEYVKRDLLALDLDPEAQVIELLHKAAYRTTLGNSIYTPSYLVGKHSPQQLKQFVDAHYTAGNLSILALGADQDSVTAIHRRGDLLTPTTPGPVVKPPKAKYHGGELRKDTDNELVHVAVATESVGLKDDNAAAVQVLEQIMGGYPRIRYSNGSTSAKLAKAIASATKAPFATRCLNYAYSDSGLFGFHIVTGKDDIAKAVKAAAGAFSSVANGGITEEDVKNAKTRAKAELHFGEESSLSHIFSLARQVALTGQVIAADKAEAAINKVSLQDVQNVAKKVLQSKPTLAAVGDLSKTPYLDELRS